VSSPTSRFPGRLLTAVPLYMLSRQKYHGAHCITPFGGELVHVKLVCRAGMVKAVFQAQIHRFPPDHCSYSHSGVQVSARYICRQVHYIIKQESDVLKSLEPFRYGESAATD